MTIENGALEIHLVVTYNTDTKEFRTHPVMDEVFLEGPVYNHGLQEWDTNPHWSELVGDTYTDLERELEWNRKAHAFLRILFRGFRTDEDKKLYEKLAKELERAL